MNKKEEIFLRKIKDKASIDDIVEEVYHRIVPKLTISFKIMSYLAIVRKFERSNLEKENIENFVYFWITYLRQILQEPMYPPGITSDQRYYIVSQILLRLDVNKPSGWIYENILSYAKKNKMLKF